MTDAEGAGLTRVKPPLLRAPPVTIAVTAMLIISVVIMALGIAQVARRQEVVRLGYDLAKATEALTRAQEENRRLRLEKATLTSPERIQSLAASIGMVQSDPARIRFVEGPREESPMSERPR